MSLDDRARIRHIYDAAVRAREFAEGMTRADLSDTAVQTYAITRLLEIIGEAAKAVTPEIRARYPNIPWREVARLRDRLIHGYFDVDLDILWDIVVNDLPIFTADLRRVIEAEGF